MMESAHVCRLMMFMLVCVGPAQSTWLDPSRCPLGCLTCYLNYAEIRCRTCTAGYAHYGVYDTCNKCGDRCRSCTFNKNGLGACNECYPGAYRNPNPPFIDCLPCTQCTTGQETVLTCNSQQNTACNNCGRGAVVRPDVDGTSYCLFCVNGMTYASDDALTCLTCRVCTAPNQYLTPNGQCTRQSNTVCADCTDNKATSANNLGTCDTCQAGFFKVASGTTFICQRCTDVPCGNNFFIQCTNAQRQCTLCPGTTSGNACEIGHEPSISCPGTATTPSECRACLKGTERPSKTLSLMCTRCAQVGFYKDRDGPENCGPCTNRPQSNSVYLSWGNSVPDNANCPW